ncbi:MAG: hypothetical protein ACYS8W_13975 [Planctomycetota bacterium]|jgi:hypothetical protein
MKRTFLLFSFLSIAACGCGSTIEFVRTEAYSQTWCGLETPVIELASPRFSTRVVLVPMFHIADPGFYDSVKKTADEFDIVFVEGLHGLDNELLAREKERLVPLLRPLWLAPQITALRLGNNMRIAQAEIDYWKKVINEGGSFFASLENVLKQLSADSGAGGFERIRELQSGTREPKNQLAGAVKDAVERLAERGPDFIVSRNKILVGEVEKALAASGGNAPEKIAVLYAAPHAPGIIELLKKRMDYEVVEQEPVWQNVWAYRRQLSGGRLPHRSGLKIEAGRDALLIRHRKELWQCFFAPTPAGGLNVVVVYYQFRNGKWSRRQMTGFPDESGKPPKNEPVTYEEPYFFLHESGAKFTPVLLQSVDTTYILVHAVKSGDDAVIYLDPAQLPDGKWLSAGFAVFPGGGCFPLGDQKTITLGPEYNFRRKP